MVDSFRKQLDALMGANRNGDSIEVKRKYYDRDVCRPFLAGLCPHDLFTLTKMDLGPCPKVHSLQLRKEYNEASTDNYDRELEDCLEKHLLECERKIQRCLKRLDDEDMNAATAIAVSVVTQSPEVQEFTRQIKLKLKEAETLELEGRMEDKALVMKDVEALRSHRADVQAALLLVAFNKDRSSQPFGNPLAPLPQLPPDANPQDVIKERLKKAEELGEQGMVDEAQKAMEEAEALKKLVPRPDGDHRVLPPDARVADQKLRVCDICGAYLSIYDSDRRLADHFGGKLHLGYMRIREKLAEIRQAKEQRQKAVREKEPDLVDSKPRDRAISRERDHEREKPAERSRDRDSRHSRDRDRDRYHERSRDRERDRSYGRDRDRGRRRSRSRSRERVRERSRDLSPRERRDRERHR